MILYLFSIFYCVMISKTMEIRKIPQQKSEWEKRKHSSHSIADTSSVIFEINQQTVQVKKAKIKDIARGLAEVAYSMGDTNNPEEFAEVMAEDIFAGLKEAEKRRKKKKSK